MAKKWEDMYKCLVPKVQTAQAMEDEMGEDLSEYLHVETLEEEKERRRKQYDNSIPTGFYFSDGEQLRFKRGGITLICSQSGYGQTSVITTFALNEAIRNRDEKTGEMTIFINHEADKAEEFSLLLNNYVGVPYENAPTSGELRDYVAGYFRGEHGFYKGTLPNGKTYEENFKEKYEEFLRLVSEGGTMLFAEGMKIHIDELVGYIEYAARTFKLSSIFIENLDLRYISSREEDLFGCLQRIKKLAEKYNIAVAFSHHLTHDCRPYEEDDLLYDTCIAVHLMKGEKEYMYAKVFKDWNVIKGSTAQWGWVGKCKKILPNID